MFNNTDVYSMLDVYLWHVVISGLMDKGIYCNMNLMFTMVTFKRNLSDCVFNKLLSRAMALLSNNFKTTKPHKCTYILICARFYKGFKNLLHIFIKCCVIPLIERQINAQIRTCKTCNFTICLTKVLVMLVQQVQIQTTIQHVIKWTEVNILNTLLIP